MMADKIRIVKKNDEYNSEYEVGDVFEVTGTWYGGVHIIGKTGVPVSLDKDEYAELGKEPDTPLTPAGIYRSATLFSILKERGCPQTHPNICTKYWPLPNIRKTVSGLSFIRRCTPLLRRAPDHMLCL